MIKVKVDVKVMPIEAGWYILIYDPRQTNWENIYKAISSVDKEAPDANFAIIPSHDPDSIRLLKTELPIKVEGE